MRQLDTKRTAKMQWVLSIACGAHMRVKTKNQDYLSVSLFTKQHLIPVKMQLETQLHFVFMMQPIHS